MFLFHTILLYTQAALIIFSCTKYYNTLRARRSGSSITVPVSESQFVEWVQGSGGVILVSPIWLQEVIYEFFHLIVREK